jgi:nucleotide-binding universal stress UspA family protein
VRTGEPAHEIVECARALDARVIVVGRGRHAAVRALGGETVLRLLQLGDTPVLAAEAKLTELPTRVVVATDFSEFSVYAAQVALSLVAPNARHAGARGAALRPDRPGAARSGRDLSQSRPRRDLSSCTNNSRGTA